MMGLKNKIGTKVKKTSDKMLCGILEKQLKMAKSLQQTVGKTNRWTHLTPEERFVAGRLLGYKIALIKNVLKVGSQSDKFSKEYYLYNYRVDVINERLHTLLYQKQEPYVYYELSEEFNTLKGLFEKVRGNYAAEIEQKVKLLERSYDNREMTLAYYEKSGLEQCKYEEVYSRLYEEDVLNLELVDAYLDFCLEKLVNLDVTDVDFGDKFLKWNWKIANVINRVEEQYQ